MTAISVGNIPSHINTVERLLVFAAQALQASANGATVAAITGEGAQPACQVQVATIADNTDRFVISAFIPCNRIELNSLTEKTWMAAQDLTQTSLNAVFTSN